MIWDASSKHRSSAPARIWDKRSPRGAYGLVLGAVELTERVQLERAGRTVQAVPRRRPDPADHGQAAFGHPGANGPLQSRQVGQQVAHRRLRPWPHGLMTRKIAVVVSGLSTGWGVGGVGAATGPEGTVTATQPSRGRARRI